MYSYKTLRVTAKQKFIIDIPKKKKKRNSKIALKIVIKSQEKKQDGEIYQNKSKTMNKMAIRAYISLITLNVNRLSASPKKHRMAE